MLSFWLCRVLQAADLRVFLLRRSLWAGLQALNYIESPSGQGWAPCFLSLSLPLQHLKAVQFWCGRDRKEGAPVVPTETQISWTDRSYIPWTEGHPSPLSVSGFCALQWVGSNLNNSLFANICISLFAVVNGERGVMLLLVLHNAEMSQTCQSLKFNILNSNVKV